MAQVKTSFSVSGNKKIIGAINRMLEAIEDEFIYGAEFDYEEDASSMGANVDNIDFEGVLGWTALFQTALKENGRKKFSFVIEGTADNDYGEFTAFYIKCTQSSISKKEHDFEIEMDADEDFTDRQEKIWDAEDEAKEALIGIEEESISEIDYDSEEYDIAVEAAEEYFEELE